MFRGPVVFGGPGTEAKKTHIFRKRVVLGLAAEGGMEKQKNYGSGKCVAVWPWYPRPPKTHLAKTHFGIPLTIKQPQALTSQVQGESG